MKKIVLVYGLLAGTIVGVLILLAMPLWNRGLLNHENGAFVGYTTMVISFTMIFFGIKSYRDNYNQGIVTFWKGIQIGMLITLVACVMYALAWEVALKNMSNDFIQEAMDYYHAKEKAAGATVEELKEMESFSELYKNNFLVRFGFSIMEPLPVGIIITLLSSALLRKKDFLPAENKSGSTTVAA